MRFSGSGVRKQLCLVQQPAVHVVCNHARRDRDWNIKIEQPGLQSANSPSCSSHWTLPLPITAISPSYTAELWDNKTGQQNLTSCPE